MKKFYFWFVWAASLVLFLSPIPTESAEGLGLDKVYHLLIFGFLMYLALRAHQARKGLLFALLVAYAFAIELIQGYLLTSRAFDVYDLAAGFAGLVLVYYAKNYFKNSPQT